MHMSGHQMHRQATHRSSSCAIPVKVSVGNATQLTHPEPQCQIIHHSKRQLLLGAVSLVVAPFLAQHAEARPALYSISDSFSSALDGFDGVGGSNADYATAELREIAVGNSGGVASVHVDGFEQLMPIFIGVAEAAALVYATTRSEGRRPSTLGTWKRSLEATGSKVERVVITRLVDHTYYSRIVLALPGGSQSSVDSRPSDSLALALQCEAPLYVARQLAEEQQSPAEDEALTELEELESGAASQEASLGRSRGLQASGPGRLMQTLWALA